MKPFDRHCGESKEASGKSMYRCCRGSHGLGGIRCHRRLLQSGALAKCPQAPSHGPWPVLNQKDVSAWWPGVVTTDSKTEGCSKICKLLQCQLQVKKVAFAQAEPKYKQYHFCSSHWLKARWLQRRPADCGHTTTCCSRPEAPRSQWGFHRRRSGSSSWRIGSYIS